MEQKMTKLGTQNENTPHGNTFDATALQAEVTNRKVMDAKLHVKQDYEEANKKEDE
jgi:hypothetical protein